MDDYVTRQEYLEYQKRIDDENRRQNKRIEKTENNIQQITDLVLSVNKLAANVEQLAIEQKKFGSRLDKIEEVPGKSWSTLKTAILTAIGAAVGAGIVVALVGAMV